MTGQTVHFAVFKWKPDAPIAEIEGIFENQKIKIVSAIPGIRSFEWGRNRSPYANGFSHALVVTADDQGAIDRYRVSDLRKETQAVFGAWMGDHVSADIGQE